MTDAERIAAHEAGHACACVLLGVPVRLIDVAGDATSLGRVRHGLEQVTSEEDARKRMIIILCGQIEGAEDWGELPSWPLNPDASTEEHNLYALARYLDLDAHGFDELKFNEALKLTLDREYRLLVRRDHRHAGLHAPHRPQAARPPRRAREGGRMEHLTFKAVTTTTTDQGIFEAVISSEAVDREQDIVVAAAMVDALRAWTVKKVPLHWNHSSDPEDIVGHVDPVTVREVDREVVAGGWVDRDTNRGREVWRLMKSGTLGFSFGYIIGASTERPGGGREITKLDVFEITATTAPMNNGTRVLSTKALDEFDHVRTKARDDMLELLSATPEPVATKSIPLPVQIASFEC